MKRIYACIAIVAVLLGVAFYSSWKVQSFAEVISADLDAAAEAIRNADHPAARQALAAGAALTLQMAPHTDQPGQQIAVLGQLHLQAALLGFCPLSENIQDQAAAVQHLNAQQLRQHPLL